MVVRFVAVWVAHIAVGMCCQLVQLQVLLYHHSLQSHVAATQGERYNRPEPAVEEAGVAEYYDHSALLQVAGMCAVDCQCR